jgi:hypothetical protein
MRDLQVIWGLTYSLRPPISHNPDCRLLRYVTFGHIAADGSRVALRRGPIATGPRQANTQDVAALDLARLLGMQPLAMRWGLRKLSALLVDIARYGDAYFKDVFLRYVVTSYKIEYLDLAQVPNT